MPLLLPNPSPPLGQAVRLNKEHPLAAGLLGAWAPMFQASGSSVRDLTMGGGDLPLVSTTGYGSSAHGLGLQADAAGEGALLTSMPTRLRPSAAVTLVWLGTILGTADANALFTGTLYDNVSSSPFTPYALGRNGSNILWWTGTSVSSFDALTGTSAAPANGTFAQLAGVYISGDKRLYVNGAQVVSSSTVTGTISYGATAEFSTGASSSFSRNINTLTYAVLVYDRALSSQEIWQLWAPQTRWELFRPAKWRTIVAAAPAATQGLVYGARPDGYVGQIQMQSLLAT